VALSAVQTVGFTPGAFGEKVIAVEAATAAASMVAGVNDEQAREVAGGCVICDWAAATAEFM